MNYDIIQVGKVIVERSPGGRVTFTDRRGLKRTCYGEPFVLQLLEAAEHGSGSAVPTVYREGSEPNRNVIVGEVIALDENAQPVRR
jgi:hypothetical protein